MNRGLRGWFWSIAFLSVILAFSLSGCANNSKHSDFNKKEVREHLEVSSAVRVITTSFEAGEYIPDKYTCQGEDLSPALNWEGYPENVKSFVLIVEDPDAPIGTFYHWVLYDIPPDINSLPEGITNEALKAKGIKVGTNDFRRLGYGGPCPPPGNPHRYFFKVFALDIESVGLPEGANARQVLKAIEGHVIAQGDIYGLYKR